MLDKYKVREGFHVHRGPDVHPPGTILELDDKAAHEHRLQIEPVDVPDDAGLVQRAIRAAKNRGAPQKQNDGDDNEGEGDGA